MQITNMAGFAWACMYFTEYVIPLKGSLYQSVGRSVGQSVGRSVGQQTVPVMPGV